MATFAETGEPEEPLAGGDVTAGVVKVGATVRRPVQPQTPAVHAFLRHLEAAGFAGAPRVLGIDDQGREVLSFVPGEVPPRPLPAWAATDEALADLASLQRSLHQAAAGFEPPPDAAWDLPAEVPGLPLLPEEAPELVSHCDITPDNTVFRDGRPWALIDFDLARPTSRLGDILVTLRHWAPMADPVDRDPALAGADAGARMRLFADAYGLGAAERGRLLDLTELRLARSWHLMKGRAERLGGGWARMWGDGVGDRIRRAQRWLERERPALAARLA